MVISSLVVEVMPDCVHDAHTALVELEGVEVHSTHENRLVVTIEAETVDESHDTASSFVRIPGVYGVNFEDDPTLFPHDLAANEAKGEGA